MGDAAEAELLAEGDGGVEGDAVAEAAQDDVGVLRAQREGVVHVVAERRRDMHRAAHEPAARDGGDFGQEISVRRDGVIDAARPRKFQPLGAHVDEDGRRLLIDEELAEKDAQKIGADDGDVLPFHGAQPVDRRLGERDVVHEQRVFVVELIGEHGEAFGRDGDEFAEIPVRRPAAQQEIVLGEIFVARTRVGRVDDRVQKKTRPLGKMGGVLRHDAHGVPPGDDGEAHFERAAEDGAVRPVDEDFGDAHAHLSLLARGVLRLRTLQVARGNEFPFVHIALPPENFVRPGMGMRALRGAHILSSYYTAAAANLQVFRAEFPQTCENGAFSRKTGGFSRFFRAKKQLREGAARGKFLLPNA